MISKNNLIAVNRGDTLNIPVTLNIGTGVNPVIYEMKPGDCLFFALLEINQKWEDALLKKVFNYDDWIHNKKKANFYLSCDDLEYLVPGIYNYQIKLFIKEDERFNHSESVITIIPRTKFTILE